MFANRSGGPGLSINTTAANSSSTNPPQNLLFGAAATTQGAAPTMFGATNNASQSGGGGLLGGGNTAGGSSLFGQARPSTSSLFGPTGTQNQTTTTASVFGALNAPAPQPEAQKPSPFSGFSLNLPSTSTATTTQPTGSFFGGSTMSQPSNTTFGAPTANSSSNLFGASAAAPSKPSLFGPHVEKQPATNTSSLFGTQPQQQIHNQLNTSVFGGHHLTMGQGQFMTQAPPTTQQPQTVPGVQIDLTNLRPTTRFHDLHPELAKIITEVDNFILAQQHQCSEISQTYNAMISLTDSISPDIEYVSDKLRTAEHGIETDAAAVNDIRSSVRHDAAEARVSFRAIDGLKLPEQFRSNIERDSRDIFYLNQPNHGRVPQSRSVNLPPSTALDNADFFDAHDTNKPRDIHALFAERSTAMSLRLEDILSNMREIELHLQNVEVDILQKGRELALRSRDGAVIDAKEKSEEQARLLVGAMRDFDDGVKSVQERVDTVKEEIRSMQGAEVGLLAGKSRFESLYESRRR